MNLDELKARALRAGWDVRDFAVERGGTRMLLMTFQRTYLGDDGNRIGFPAYQAHVSDALQVCKLINDGRDGYATEKTYHDETALWKAMQGARRRALRDSPPS